MFNGAYRQVRGRAWMKGCFQPLTNLDKVLIV